MKTFIPKGDKFIITAASFIAPQTVCGFIANNRYTLDQCVADIKGGCIHGSALNHEGEWWLIDKAYNGPFDEKVVIQVHESYDNHRAQKKALRHRHMLIRAFVKLGHSYGWCDSKIKRTCFNINRKRGNKHETHTLKEWARQMAAPYFNDDGSLAKAAYMIDAPDHEINQEFFDEMAEEDLSNW